MIRTGSQSPRRAVGVGATLALALALALAVITVGAASWPVPARAAERQLVDRVVALVDDEPILLSEVVQEMNLVRLQRQLGDLTADEQKQLYQNVLDDMINDQLLVVEAKSKGYEVSEEELRQSVDEAVRSIKERLGGEERYRAELQKQGLTEVEVRDMHRDQKRKQILAGRVVQADIRKQVVISDAQVQEFWDTQRDSIPPEILSTPEKLKLEHILVAAQPDPEKIAAARAKIAAAQKRVAAGEDFAAVAKEVSEWPTGKNGGYLGAFRYGDFESTAFDEAVAKLEPGQVSDVISTRYGLQIVRLETRTGDEMTARHIVAKLETSEEDQVRALNKAIALRERILTGESFEEIARAESDDPNTRDQGGLVEQEIASAELIPEFRAALDSVQVGGVTRVVRSAQGFHMFKLVARSDARAATFDDTKEMLRRWLEQRQLEIRYRTYIADLRKKFHVDVKA